VQKRAIENLTAQQGRQCKQSAPIPSEEEERNGKKKKEREMRTDQCDCGDEGVCGCEGEEGCVLPLRRLVDVFPPSAQGERRGGQQIPHLFPFPSLPGRTASSLSLLSVCAATARNKKTERKRRELGGATRQSGLDFCAWFVAVWGPCDSELAMWDSVALSVDFVP
jgi:hypothetical protein